jgi:hypothetical protein
MNHRTTQLLIVSTAAFGCTAAANAQLAITWSSIDGGGSTVASTGGAFALAGTIGQPDAGSHSGGAFTCQGGFWAAGTGPAPCYANCDGSTTAPVLNVSDFICFQTKYAANDPYANCDGSTIVPVLNVSDFICFQSQYAAGCP